MAYKIIRIVENFLITLLKIYCGDTYNSLPSYETSKASSSKQHQSKQKENNFLESENKKFRNNIFFASSEKIKYSFAIGIVFIAIGLLSFKYSTINAQKNIEKSLAKENTTEMYSHVISRKNNQIENSEYKFFTELNLPREKQTSKKSQKKTYQYNNDKIVIDISSLVSNH